MAWQPNYFCSEKNRVYDSINGDVFYDCRTEEEAKIMCDELNNLMPYSHNTVKAYKDLLTLTLKKTYDKAHRYSN